MNFSEHPFVDQSEGLVGEHLVDREAVVQFHDLDVARIHSGLFVNPLRSNSSDVRTDHFEYVVVGEDAGEVGDQLLSCDRHARREAVGTREIFAAYDGGAGSAGGRAGLQTSQAAVQCL